MKAFGERALLLFLQLLATVALSAAAFWPAQAADTMLPIHVRLVRCVSQEERYMMCRSESLCCEFIDGANLENAAAEEEQQLVVLQSYPQPLGKSELLWIKNVSQRPADYRRQEIGDSF